MPIYEYGCMACGHKTDILHGIHEEGPHFCPGCGAEATMRKGIAVPAIVFKGSGWAKKDRSAGSRAKASGREDGSGDQTKPADSKDEAASRTSGSDGSPSDSSGPASSESGSRDSAPRKSSDSPRKAAESASGSGASAD